MGLFHPFLDDRSVEIYGVEAAGHGVPSGQHAASVTGGRPGVLHGNRTYLLMDDDGQITEAHSISAGLDYPGIGPEHAWLNDMGRVKFLSATDEAIRLGNPILGNIVMIGAVAGLGVLPIDRELFETVIREGMPAAKVKANLRAFAIGETAVA
jgi:tellurite resistance-related uncharacterized protein